jgi:hypothetical protein
MVKCKDCDKYASYGISGGKAVYCFLHKLENMINIYTKKCIEEGCTTQAHYNFINEKTPIYCSPHKKKQMIIVTNKSCIF